MRGDESAPVSLRPHLGFRHEDRGVSLSSCFVLKIQLIFGKGGVRGGMWNCGLCEEVSKMLGDFIYDFFYNKLVLF